MSQNITCPWCLTTPLSNPPLQRSLCKRTIDYVEAGYDIGPVDFCRMLCDDCHREWHHQREIGFEYFLSHHIPGFTHEIKMRRRLRHFERMDRIFAGIEEEDGQHRFQFEIKESYAK